MTRMCGIEAVDQAYVELSFVSLDLANHLMDAVEQLIKRHDVATQLCVPSHRDYGDKVLATYRRAVRRAIEKVSDLIG